MILRPKPLCIFDKKKGEKEGVVKGCANDTSYNQLIHNVKLVLELDDKSGYARLERAGGRVGGLY